MSGVSLVHVHSQPTMENSRAFEHPLSLTGEHGEHLKHGHIPSFWTVWGLDHPRSVRPTRPVFGGSWVFGRTSTQGNSDATSTIIDHLDTTFLCSDSDGVLNFHKRSELSPASRYISWPKWARLGERTRLPAHSQKHEKPPVWPCHPLRECRCL